jgi:hypothetical protein
VVASRAIERRRRLQLLGGVQMESTRLSRQRIRSFAFFVVLAASLLALAAPAPMRAQDASPAAELAAVPRGPDTSIQYVGVVGGTDIYVAVVDQGAGIFNVYLCDGNEIAVWLEGTGDAGGFEATAEDGATARGTIVDGTASGTVTLTGKQTLTFAAPRAELAAGLYERVWVEDGEPVQARTIVLADGTAKGKKKKFECARAQRTFKEAMRLAELEGNEEFGDDYYEVAYDWVRRASNAGCEWAQP